MVCPIFEPTTTSILSRIPSSQQLSQLRAELHLIPYICRLIGLEASHRIQASNPLHAVEHILNVNGDCCGVEMLADGDESLSFANQEEGREFPDPSRATALVYSRR